MDQPSPNQQLKREQVVRAAMAVMARDGLAGCTARGIAAAAPLTKSAIHYYFQDTADLVDRAVEGHVAAFVTRLVEAPAPTRDAVADFWAAFDTYLATLRERPELVHLWLEHRVAAARRGRDVTALHARLTALLADRLEAAGDLTAGRTATSVFTFLLGALLEQPVEPGSLADVRARVARLTGLPRVTVLPGA